MRALTTAAQAALAAQITRPLWLIEMALSPALRLCSFDTVSWAGAAWSGDAAVQVRIDRVDGSGRQAGTLELGNEAGVFGAILMGQQVNGARVRVWGGDAAALATADPVLMFDGVIAGAEVTVDTAQVRIAAQGARTLLTPRRYVDKAGGFSVLLPAGTRLNIGGEVVVLERRR